MYITNSNINNEINSEDNTNTEKEESTISTVYDSESNSTITDITASAAKTTTKKS